MPSWTSLSDTEVVGNTGHTTVHNNLADDLALLGKYFGLGGSNIATKTSDYSITLSDFYILASSASGNVTITLPDATTCAGQQFIIECIDATNTVIIATTSAQTINGLTPGHFDTGTTYTGIWVVSDGVNWHTLGDKGMARTFIATGNGFNTQSSAAITTPTFVSGTGQVLNYNADTMLYIAVQTSAALAVAISPDNVTYTTIMPSKSYALSCTPIRVPTGWFAKITGTIADLTITAVTC
jgi:hypothetical protein